MTLGHDDAGGWVVEMNQWCTDCGQRLEQGVRFCTSCGADAGPDAAHAVPEQPAPAAGTLPAPPPPAGTQVPGPFVGEPVAGRPRRRGRAVAAVVALLAAVGVVGWVLSMLLGDDEPEVVLAGGAEASADTDPGDTGDARDEADEAERAPLEADDGDPPPEDGPDDAAVDPPDDQAGDDPVDPAVDRAMALAADVAAGHWGVDVTCPPVDRLVSGNVVPCDIEGGDDGFDQVLVVIHDVDGTYGGGLWSRSMAQSIDEIVADVGGSGLFCRDVAAAGYPYHAAVAYWLREGRPERMDAAGDGIPCGTVYEPAAIETYWQQSLSAIP